MSKELKKFSLPVAIGVGVGLLGYFLLRPAAVPAHAEQRRRIRNNDESANEYFATPGEKCVICQEDMDNDDMYYLNCNHALHSACYRETKQRKYNKCPMCRADM